MRIKLSGVDIWQKYMEDAYARWQEGGDLHQQPRDVFLAAIKPYEKEAVMLGNLNYQVGNGGFVQWIDNRYVKDIYDIIDLLKTINGQKCQQVIGMLKTILKFVDPDIRDFWKDQGEEFEDMPDGYDEVQALDNQYYSIQDDFMDEVGSYFVDQWEEQNGGEPKSIPLTRMTKLYMGRIKGIQAIGKYLEDACDKLSLYLAGNTDIPGPNALIDALTTAKNQYPNQDFHNIIELLKDSQTTMDAALELLKDINLE